MSEKLYNTAVYTSTAQWDQSSFHAFQAGRDPALVAADEACLREIFKAVASPTSKQAFAWAQAHDVKFFIDHTLKRAGAYYTMGTGVVGLSARYAHSVEMAAPLLVHEIRHAWQDQKGFIPTVGRNFAEYFMQLSLMEADALAFEHVSGREERMLGNTFENEGMKPPLLSPQSDRLAQGFEKWTKQRAQLYGDTAARHFGTLLNIDGIKPTDFGMSYQPFKDGGCPQIKGIDVADVRSALATGAGFDGTGNYLDTEKMRGYLEQKLLKPTLAQKFYVASANLPVLVKEVNKRFRTAQTAHRKKTGQDLYL